jgi:hypothetical protein
VSDNPILYSQFGIANENHTITLVMTSSANITSGLIGEVVTQNSTYGKGTIGTVTAVNAATRTVEITRTVTTQQVVTGYCYIKNITFNIESFSITEFTIPARPSETLGNTEIVYAINTSPVTSITIPDDVVVTTLEADTISVGDIVDLETTLTSLQAQIDLIKVRIGMS